MNKKYPLYKTGLVLLLTILVVLALTAVVYAEGDLPPEEAPPESEPAMEETPPEPVAVETAPDEIPPPDEVAPEEELAESEAPEEELPLPEEPTVEETEEELPPEESTPEEGVPPQEELSAEENAAVEEAPAGDLSAEVESIAGANLELEDASGTSIDLASHESAQVLTGADPYFKVGTTTYRFFSSGTGCAPYPGDPNCYDGLGSPISAALNHIETYGTIPTDRKIYVETGTYTENVTVDGSQPNMGTINGLIGVDGSANITINGNVDISNLAGGFTLKGFKINGGVYVHDAAGTFTLEDLVVKNSIGDGINMSSNFAGKVDIKDTTSSGNAGSGAWIENYPGTGFITITNSTFDDNDDFNASIVSYGLYLQSGGPVTLNGVSASHNNGTGVYLVDPPKTVFIKNSVFIGNDTSPDIDGTGYGILLGTGSKGKVTFDNVYIADHPDNYGASISTAGSVQISNTTAHHNLNSGIRINTTSGTGTVKFKNGSFYLNGHSGLEIKSHGAVTLDSVKANDNLYEGVFIDTCDESGGVCLGKGGVTVTSQKSAGLMGVNTFNGNLYNGLNIKSQSNINITNIIANGNTYCGVAIINTHGTSAGVTIKSNLTKNEYANFVNEFIDNGRHGLSIQSNGTVKVDRFEASENTWDGLAIDNSTSTKKKNVTVANGTADENDLVGYDIDSNGSISLQYASASSHPFGNGAHLDNTTGTGNVTVKGKKGLPVIFNDNSGYGLEIYSNGKVTLSCIQAENNTSENVYVDNTSAGSSKSVKVSDGVFNSSTSDDGLAIDSNGPITLKNITAQENAGSGLQLDNSNGKATIKLTNAVLTDNTSYGANLGSKRAITITNVQANSNDDTGIRARNCYWSVDRCTGSGGVTVTASSKQRNEFNENLGNGLEIQSGGTISVKNFTAQDNDENGVHLKNNYAFSTGKIIIGGSSKNPNLISGNLTTLEGGALRAYSRGNISISYTISEHNHSQGAILDNASSVTPKTVTVKDSSFNFNVFHGLEIDSNGTVTLNGVEAMHTSVMEGNITPGDDVWEFLSYDPAFPEDKWWFNSSGSVTIDLSSTDFDAYLELRDATGGLLTFDDNSGTSGGDALISGFSLPAAGDYYIVVKDAAGTDGGNYTLKLNSGGSSHWYYYYGIHVDNNGGTGNVVIKPGKNGYGVRVSNNNYIGFNITTNGSISLKKVWAITNGSTGIYMENLDPAEKNITLTDVYSESNGNCGFYIQTFGNASVKKGSANSNINDGIYIDAGGASKARNVTITNFTANFNGGSNGIRVTTGGNITLNSITADDNDPTKADGAYLSNCQYSGGVCTGTGNVTIGGKNNSFSGNDNGLYIQTGNDVFLSNLTAVGNYSYGVHVFNYYGQGNVTVKNTVSRQFNVLSGNGNNGLYIFTVGNVTISKVFAEGNSANNVYIYNRLGSLPYFVRVSNSILNKSIGGGTSGLYVDSNGAITITNVQAYFNGQHGIRLINDSAPDMRIVRVSKSIASDNNSFGMSISSNGNVELNTIQACRNQNDGIHIVNSSMGGKVTVKGSSGENIINDNLYDGLFISAGSTISLDRITALRNGYSGISLSHIPAVSGSVTAKRLTLIENGYQGIYMNTDGVVLLDKVTAIYNGSSGDYSGIEIDTQVNPVTIKNSVILGNTGYGIELDLNPAPYTIISTYNLGNDSNNSGGEVDLYVQ